MRAKHSLEFARKPPLWSAYPKLVMSRKPSLVPEGRAVPRIESHLANVAIDRRNLDRYQRICGIQPDGTLPIAYPHVLATPLHVAILGAEAFPVKLFGLVHVRNRILLRRPLSIDEPATIQTWIEGHRETDRGQEFDLHTAYIVEGTEVWNETCTFFARRKAAPGASKPAAAPGVGGPPDATAIRTSTFSAPAGLGRRYGFVSGDLNPIHLSNLTARAFGFPKAIAHGMWSLARLAAEFDPEGFAGGCEFTGVFKLPVFLPSTLTLQRWAIDDGAGFALRDARGDKSHVTGTLKSAA